MAAKERAKVLEDKIKAEKLSHDVSEAAAKISALKSGDIDKYEFLTEQEVIPRGAEASLASAQFEYSPLGKAFEKQVQAIETQGEKQVQALKEVASPDRTLYPPHPSFVVGKRATDAWNNAINITNKLDKAKLDYKSRDFGHFELPATLTNLIGSGELPVSEARSAQKNFKRALNSLEKMNQTRERDEVLKNANELFEARRKVINNFINRTYPIDKVVLSKPTVSEGDLLGPLIVDPDDTLTTENVDQPSSSKDPGVIDVVSPRSTSEYKMVGRNHTMYFSAKYDFSKISPVKTISKMSQKEAKKLFDDWNPLHEEFKTKKTSSDELTTFKDRKRTLQLRFDKLKEIAMKDEKGVKGGKLKVMSSNQMLQRLPIVFGHIRAGNNSQSLRNEALQILYSLFRDKKISKKNYDSLIKKV